MHFDRGDHVELAEALVSVLGAAVDVVGDEGKVWRYNAETGRYAEIDRASQSRAVQSFAGAACGEKGKALTLDAKDVYGAMRLAYDRVAVQDFFANAPAGTVFTNGFATVTANGIELRPHARENRARYGFAFELSSSSLAPKHLKFLYDVWAPDADREEKVLLWQEFGGAALLGIAPTYQRCLVSIGDGCNGKSKAGDILLAVMPEGSTCSIAPQEFGQEYRRAMLAGKRLNVVNELPEADILESESFKNIITGETITGRHIREAPITFRPKAAHYFAANRLPGTNDQTLGFWRRFLVATFNRNFSNDPVRNARIAEEIIAAEKPAIVRWFLEGAVRLCRERNYTVPASHHAAMGSWRRSADPVALFIEERTETCQPIEGSAASWLYTNFRTWADRNGHRPMSSTKFGLRMKDLGKPATHFDTGNRYPVRLTSFDETHSANNRGRSDGYN
jgi:P4 family phage/plasmid primase-like protien